MRIPAIFTCLFLTLVAANAWAYGVDGATGVRLAEKIDATHLCLIIGHGCNTALAVKEPDKFQIASPTDVDFQRGVAAEAVRITPEPDAEYPAHWNGPTFQRYRIDVTLPEKSPLKPEHRYWIRVNSNWIMAFNRRGCWITEPGASTPASPRYGIRETYALTPNIVHVITGPGLDLARLTDLRNITLSSADDDDFRTAQNPIKVGRRSNLDAYTPEGWPWRFSQRHELFLVFEKPLKEGRRYRLNLNAAPQAPIALEPAATEISFDSTTLLNLAIKVNQVGYLPDAEKHGYLGMWMGDLNACDFSACAKGFEVRDAKTHAVVFSGAPTLRKKATYKLVNSALQPDPKQTPGPETVYKQDLSYEDVYDLDFSALKQQGEYYVAIPGMGRSFSFRVGPDIYTGPLKTMMNGLFHQRSGIELKAPWTEHYSPAGHRATTEFSTFRNGVDKDPWKNLPHFATDGVKHDIFGGHYDAGDWNPRSHLEVAEVLFLLYEMNPQAFTDGQFNIPESRNGVPDLLDEARNALDLWVRLQDEDGGVRNGIESNGDPEPGDIAATDRKREFAFAKDASASYRFAAVAAQGAIVFKNYHGGKLSEVYQRHALEAWKWAEANGGAAEHDQHAFAAAMLWRLTGDRKFDEAFKAHSVFSKDPNAKLDQWQKHDQVYASYYYASNPAGDAALRANIVRAFERTFSEWTTAAETTAYRYMREPHSPNTWGTGGLPKHAIKPAMTMHLTADEKIKAQCRRWLLFSNDFSLGCHPMNLVFTVGLGQRHVHGAWHLLMVNSPAGLIPGLQSEGPGGDILAGEVIKGGGMGRWPGMSLYPPGPWPDLYKFSEHASPGMSEGLTVNMVQTAFAYGLFASATERK
ncbi:MAG TPA: glycoside hydrolase family 9 protein [Planctomycetota bacterium]|nr:glycoside hydrolase family 9 protein [Planctomycetota bacterium]